MNVFNAWVDGDVGGQEDMLLFLGTIPGNFEESRLRGRKLSSPCVVCSKRKVFDSLRSRGRADLAALITTRCSKM